MLKRMASSEERVKLEKWLELRQQDKRDPRGRKRFWNMFESTDTGCRLGKDGSKKLTFRSPLKAEEFQVKAWAQRAVQQGDELSEDDLLEEFKLTLESKVWEIEEQRKIHGFLLEAEENDLSLCNSRLNSLTKYSDIRYMKARLRFV